MTFNSFKINFKRILRKNLKESTHLFSLCRSSILPLMYLCTFGSSSSKIVNYNSPLCPLSNATSVIQIGFSKEELCEISHSDLIIDQFSRANLYDVPCVPVLTFGITLPWRIQFRSDWWHWKEDTEGYYKSQFQNLMI